MPVPVDMQVLTRDFPFLSLLSHLCFFCPKRKWGQLSNRRQASRSFTAPVSPRRYCRLVRTMRHFSPAEVSSSCLLIPLSRYSYSFANHPGGLLPVWEFTLRDCCAIMATIRISVICSRYPNVSNLCFQFVWRMDIIYFQNSYCRIGGVKNE